jgi:hypothetical protein
MSGEYISVSNGKRPVSNVNKRAKMFAVCAWTQIAVVRISNVSSTHAWQLLQNINKVFGISRRKFDTFYTEFD